MAERRSNSSFTNPGSPLASSPCSQWEALLTEALDGLLKPADEAVFNAHRALCPACAALYEETRQGREWLEFLSPEPETPEGLLARILAQTGPGLESSGRESLGQAAGGGLADGGGSALPKPPVFISAFTPASIPAWQRPGLGARIRRFAEPRLMMTAAMAFFSIAMTLNLTGLRLSRLQLPELRSSAVLSLPGVARAFLERRLTAASTPIIRFYDHSRLVYEVQATVRELRRTTESGGEGRNEKNRHEPQALMPDKPTEASLNKEEEDYLDSANKLASRPALALNFSPVAEPTGSDSEFCETSVRFHGQTAHSGGSRKEVRGRSTVWTA
jgi:hypothetical protein